MYSHYWYYNCQLLYNVRTQRTYPHSIKIRIQIYSPFMANVHCYQYSLKTMSHLFIFNPAVQCVSQSTNLVYVISIQMSILVHVQMLLYLSSRWMQFIHGYCSNTTTLTNLLLYHINHNNKQHNAMNVLCLALNGQTDM